MEEDKFTLSGEVCSMSSSAADALIATGDGDCALLYIYLLRHGGRRPPDMCRQLSMSAQRLEAAAARLNSRGLLRRCTPAAPAEELPEYSAEDIVRRSREDPCFTGLITETQRVLGRALSGADMRTLFGIYDHLGLPPDVILLLLNDCAEEARRRFGAGRTPTMRQIEKEAYIWANREIMTTEQAEEYIALRAQRQDSFEILRRVFGVRDREFTPTERKYIASWLDMGFPREAVEMAFDRTVVGCGSLKWPYMNKIMLSWDSKGLHTPQEIEKGDGAGKKPSPARGSSQETAPQSGDLDKLREIQRRIKNGQG